MFENSVVIQDGVHEEVLCPHCDEPLVFGMKDNTHEFSTGLTKILECLVVAEHMGYVPPFPKVLEVDSMRFHNLVNLPPEKSHRKQNLLAIAEEMIPL